MEPTRPHFSSAPSAANRQSPAADNSADSFSTASGTLPTGQHGTTVNQPPTQAADAAAAFARKTQLMGIINITPDSFSDGGKFAEPQSALEQAHRLLLEGADILDLGAESTRPGSRRVDAQEEWQRLQPALAAIRPITNAPLSVDTYKANVAEQALAHGANWINDIWGLQYDSGEMAATIARHKATVVVMHNQNTTQYSEDLILAILRFWRRSIQIASHAGIPDEHIVLDPGIGFGKTTEYNWEVLRRFDELRAIGPYRLLLGASRKSFIGNALHLPVNQRDNATLATSVIAVQKGADILRVHAVGPHAEAIAATERTFAAANAPATCQPLTAADTPQQPRP